MKETQNKDTYIIPEISVVKFDQSDIITTSYCTGNEGCAVDCLVK